MSLIIYGIIFFGNTHVLSLQCMLLTFVWYVTPMTNKLNKNTTRIGKDRNKLSDIYHALQHKYDIQTVMQTQIWATVDLMVNLEGYI